MKFLNKYAHWFAAGLLVFMFIVSVASVRGDSAIRDEVPHILAGYSYWTKLDYRINPEHPPLVKQLAAIPLLFMDINFPDDNPSWTDKVNDQWVLGDIFLYQSGNDADQMLFWGRIPIILLMLLSGVVIYLWTTELFKSKLAGLVALSLFALSPNIIAHGRYITTDMGIAAFSLFALYSWWKFLKNPNWKTFSIGTVLQACMHLAKFSSPLFLPIIGLMTIGAMLANVQKWDWKKRLKIYLGGVVAATIIAFLIVGGWYQIFISNMPFEVQQQLTRESIFDNNFQNAGIQTKLLAINEFAPILRPYTQYLLGFFMVAAHASYGHTTYFMGEIGENWPHYYFIAYLFKEPLASQILFYVAFFSMIPATVLLFRKTKSKKKKWFQENYVIIAFIILILLFMYMGMKARLQLGIRYIVPIFPYLYIMLGGFAARGLEWLKKLGVAYFKMEVGLLMILFVWLLVSNLRTYPYYLPYYNELIGGPAYGWKYLVDSNTDWGQDLRRLKTWIDEYNSCVESSCPECCMPKIAPSLEEPYPPIENLKINYFGGGNLDYYLGPQNYTPWDETKDPATGWIAVSASPIQWNSGNNNETEKNTSYHWLTDNYVPIKQIGYSIFLYYVPDSDLPAAE